MQLRVNGSHKAVLIKPFGIQEEKEETKNKAGRRQHVSTSSSYSITLKLSETAERVPCITEACWK